MNRQQIVPTLLQRQALASYLDAHRDAIYHAERVRGLHRAVVPKVEAPAPAQPEPVNFCAPVDDVPPAFTARQLFAAGLLWLAAMAFTLWLCTEVGMRFLDAIWRLA